MVRFLPYRQHDLLTEICRYADANGTTPSVRVLAAVLGVRGPATVHKHLKALALKGVVRRNGTALELLMRAEEFKRRKAEP